MAPPKAAAVENPPVGIKKETPMLGQNLLNIFSIIEQAATGAAQALAPAEPGIAQDIALGAALLQIITQLIPHAKANMPGAQPAHQ